MEKIFKAKMNIQLICAIIVFFSTGFREIRANRMVDTEPHNVTTVEGTSANFLCRFGEPISYCRFEVPGRGVLNLSPNWPSRTPGYEYFGGGLEQGQCGLSIKTIRSENNGDVKCFVGAPGEEVGGVIPLTVAIAASQTQIDLHGQNDGQFQINQVMHVTCIARDARPPADIYWYLDDQQITNGLSNIDLMELANQTGAPTTLFTTSQTLQRPIQASDDRKTLKCVTSNAANLDQPQIKTLQLTVRFAPQPLPEIRVYGVILSSTALINVTLRSNPRPRIEWNVDGNAIQQGTRTGRYEAYEPIDLGNGVFNVTLSIAGLTLEDTSKIYRLRASNEFGSQDYTVRISSSEAAISDGLGVGSIIGIVVGIIILLTIVLLIVVARIKGKWCFADSGSTTKPPHASETIDVREANHSLLTPASPTGSTSINGSDSFRVQNVYNPTTMPVLSGKNGGGPHLRHQNDYSPIISETSSFNEYDTRGSFNEVGLPTPRSSIHRWLPNQQRDLLQKQAEILSGVVGSGSGGGGGGGGVVSGGIVGRSDSNKVKKETDIF